MTRAKNTLCNSEKRKSLILKYNSIDKSNKISREPSLIWAYQKEQTNTKKQGKADDNNKKFSTTISMHYLKKE